MPTKDLQAELLPYPLPPWRHRFRTLSVYCEVDEAALDVALDRLGGAMVGSAIGAFEGTLHGAWSGDSPEGAAIGAVVGGVVGVVVGVKEPFEQQEQNVPRCLSEKGYVLET